MSAKFISDLLNKLLFEKKIRATELARETSIPQPTIHRLITGKSTKPTRSTLQPIADYFDLSIAQLKGEAPLPKFMSAKTHKSTEIPLLDWQDLTSAGKHENLDLADAKHVVAPHLSPKCFATYMNDSSMEPLFPRDCILIFDPEKQIVDRSYVLVKLHETQTYIFRQLLSDGEDKFLKPIHPELFSSKLKQLKSEDQIIASLIEARHVYA